MAVTMTEAAQNHVRNYLANRGRGLGIRLGVKTTGCSGLSYVLEFVDELQEGDTVSRSNGVPEPSVLGLMGLGLVGLGFARRRMV